jgi:hypothetical protein
VSVAQQIVIYGSLGLGVVVTILVALRCCKFFVLEPQPRWTR